MRLLGRIARRLMRSGNEVIDPDMLADGIKFPAYDRAMVACDTRKYDSISKRCRNYSMYRVLLSVLHGESPAQGAVGEVGCWKGQSAHIIADTLATFYAYSPRDTPRFYIFDSFEGLSLYRGEDGPQSINDMERRRKFFTADESKVASNLSDFSFVSIHKGWVPEKFPVTAGDKFMFLHVDVDLYHPTLETIGWFYPLMLEGGAMVFDDYGLKQFPGATRAVDECLDFFKPSFFYPAPTGGAFLIK